MIFMAICYLRKIKMNRKSSPDTADSRIRTPGMPRAAPSARHVPGQCVLGVYPDQSWLPGFKLQTKAFALVVMVETESTYSGNPRDTFPYLEVLLPSPQGASEARLFMEDDTHL
jgi:hypothetical protein